MKGRRGFEEGWGIWHANCECMQIGGSRDVTQRWQKWNPTSKLAGYWHFFLLFNGRVFVTHSNCPYQNCLLLLTMCMNIVIEAHQSMTVSQHFDNDKCHLHQHHTGIFRLEDKPSWDMCGCG